MDPQENTTTHSMHNHIDAQQIVLDTDPEAASTENLPERTLSSDKTCCCRACCCCRALLWYISPISCDIGHSILCLIYQMINFAAAIALVVWDVTCIGTSAGLVALFCAGVPLLWLTFESIIFFSRIDLAFTYYMVEQPSKVNPAREHLLNLSLYFQSFPLCCCWNRDGSSCIEVIVGRIKYLFTSCDLLCYITYHVFVKPIAWLLWCTVPIVAMNFAMVCAPIIYAAHSTPFENNKIYIGYNSKCTFDGAVECPHDYWWIINSWQRTAYVSVAALLVLPLTVRFNNFVCTLQKVVAYKFYTYYYTNDVSIISDKKSLISYKKQRINSV